MNSPDPTGKPTLESLLRLKRFERPDPEFWQQFEGELRRRQLAATIEPRPWWLGLAALGRKAAPFGLPVGAAAALTLAAVSLQTIVRSPGDGRDGVSTVASVAGSAAASADVGSSLGATVADAAGDPVSAAGEGAVAAPVLIAASAPTAVASEPDVAVPVVNASRALDVVLASLLPGMGLHREGAVSPLVEPTPSQRHIAYNLAVAEREHPMLGGAFGLRFARAVGMVAAPEQSPEARPVSDSALALDEITPRTARLLALVDAAPEAEAAVVSANIAREQAMRLNDDILYASANRLGLGGDRLSIRF